MADCILFLLYIIITHTITKMATSIVILIPTVTPITTLLVESLAVVDMPDIVVDVANVVIDSTIDIEVHTEVIDVSLVNDSEAG